MAAENVPALQEMQAEAVVAPKVDENFPAVQLMHEAKELPPDVEYLPAGQSVQDVEPSTSE